ncbi:hypothetical protein [Chitinophaga sp. sic0106]|uniref:hypothetical protein n=1 Tax=Chitinophaga sp. sic0106 TaxID=2854785 RepID=UPI001C476BC6|nr:hypothetical protein [Chitinophaga sp. sic0106]MBV7529672.1 hypothetical protein [Chitinophaga sp. sic0106]
MKKYIYTCCVLLATATVAQAQHSSPSPSKQVVVPKKGAEVPYAIAKNYYVKNSYPEKGIHAMQLKSQQEFDQVFGMAPLATKDGNPTAIDFSKKMVLALVNGSSNNVADLRVKSLTKVGKKLQVNYTLVTTPAPQSFTSRYCHLLIIDKKYAGNQVVLTAL